MTRLIEQALPRLPDERATHAHNPDLSTDYPLTIHAAIDTCAQRVPHRAEPL